MTAERRSDSTRLRRLCHAEKSSAWQAIRSCCIGPAARRCAGTSSPGLRPTAAIEAQHVKRCGGRTKPLFCYSVGMDLFQESCQVGVSSIACAQQSLTHRSCVDEQSRQPSSCNRCATSIHFCRHVSCARRCRCCARACADRCLRTYRVDGRNERQRRRARLSSAARAEGKCRSAQGLAQHKGGKSRHRCLVSR